MNRGTPRRPRLLARALLTSLAVLAVFAATAAASVPAWTTYRHDKAASGIDPDSTSPVPPQLIWRSAALDGRVWAEPLVYGSHVYVATENDTVYALDAATGAIVWQSHLATPVPLAEVRCSPIYPVIGITSTPVIDPANGRIYVVADSWDGTDQSSIAHELFGLNLADGSVATGPVGVDPPGITPWQQLQRPGLALDHGNVFIGYGSNSDCGAYHGWLVGVPETGGPLQTFEIDGGPGENAGSIWAAGGAPPIDSAGDVWVSTANGQSTTWDYQDAVLKFNPADISQPLDDWAPSYWSQLDAHDYDLGSGMPVLLPHGLVFQIGKLGVGYLLNASNLGGLGGKPVAAKRVCGLGQGGGIYYNHVLYVSCSDGMHALGMNSASKNGSLSPVTGWQVDPNGIGPPIEAGGLIWSVDYEDGVMDGINPSTGSASFSVTDPYGFEHFTTPSAGGGRLFVAEGDSSGTDQITAFQIANPPGHHPRS